MTPRLLSHPNKFWDTTEILNLLILSANINFTPYFPQRP